MVMVVVMPSSRPRVRLRDARILQRSLLNGGIILLRRLQVSRLQGLPQLIEFLQQ